MKHPCSACGKLFWRLADRDAHARDVKDEIHITVRGGKKSVAPATEPAAEEIILPREVEVVMRVSPRGRVYFEDDGKKFWIEGPAAEPLMNGSRHLVVIRGEMAAVIEPPPPSPGPPATAIEPRESPASSVILTTEAVHTDGHGGPAKAHKPPSVSISADLIAKFESARTKFSRREEGAPPNSVPVEAKLPDWREFTRKSRHGRCGNRGCSHEFLHFWVRGNLLLCDLCYERLGGKVRTLRTKQSRKAGGIHRKRLEGI